MSLQQSLLWRRLPRTTPRRPAFSMITLMSASASGARVARRTLGYSQRQGLRVVATAEAAAALPTVPTCPSPTCECAETPAMPEGLEIDRKSRLQGAVAGYAEQVLICTGRDDWSSRIEDEDGGDNLAADLKGLFGRGGMYADPFHNVTLVNASFPSSVLTATDAQQDNDATSTSSSVYLFPSFKYVPFVRHGGSGGGGPSDHVRALAKAHLLPERLHASNDELLSPERRALLTRDTEAGSATDDQGRPLLGARDVKDTVVLVCGHGGRDRRCGIMGPLLRGEFERQLARKGVKVLQGAAPPEREEMTTGGEDGGEAGTARVAVISHIGGHKFAGNVIVHVPPGRRTADGSAHPLAGCGVWYGRVEPRHVEGLVEETLFRGRIVADMFRGGVDGQRRMLRV